MFRIILPAQPCLATLNAPAAIYAAALSTHAENVLDAAAPLDDLRGKEGRDAAIRAG